MAIRTSGRKPKATKQQTESIEKKIFLPREEFRKTSPSSFQLGSKFYWLGAYGADLPSAGSCSGGGGHVPPWRLCGASNWADLYPQLLELDKQGLVPFMMMLCPALGEMPEILPDNISGIEGQEQAIARSVGIEYCPRSIGDIAKSISAKHKSLEGNAKGGSHHREKEGFLSAIRSFLQCDPNLTCRKAWDLFPDNSWAALPFYTSDGREFLVYRSGENLVQENNDTGQTLSIKFRTFESYFTESRKQVNRDSKDRRDS